MVCATCRHDNQPNAKFCSECGAALARSCPSCGRQQFATAKFCDECGTALATGQPASPTPVPAASRKRVTALFADLVGSTAFAERLDPEAVRARLAPYFELLQSTIDDHGGTVVKFLGDGVFAIFGVPEVAEDDALRAVTAGVELQRRFRSFADEVGQRHGVELGLRVGVNTGELVVGADDADLVGDVLNTASRLEAACVPGRVLAGEDTWRLTRSSVIYEALGDVGVKGRVETIATFQVVEYDAGLSDEETPFVGRVSELGSLTAVFDEAIASAGARLASVIGDPGVGKTRLAQQLRARSDARSFDLRLERRGSTTFAPIADLLREVTGTGSVDDVERLVGGHPEAARLGPVFASFLGHGGARTTEESFWAVRRLLELLAADGPVIVVVDDVQWAEPLFWDLLEHLVEWTAAPVLLLALARPELRELRPELTQPGRRVTATVALAGLDAEATLELAARLLDVDELPVELVDRLPQSTDGNPLFVRELVQMLVDDGVLARDGDGWRLTIDVEAIEVPPTILSLLASRVERLADDERQIIELASVIGTEFDRGALTAIAGGAVAGRLAAVIDTLRRKDLIEPTGQWAGDHPVYRFHHVLIRDAAYRRLLKGHRADLHERVGRHVDSTGLANDERDVVVAHHFEQVCQYRTELGTLDDRTRDLAVEAAARLRSVAEQALGREDLASAGGAAIRALRLLDAGGGAGRDELLLLGCEALLSSADVTRGAPLVDELHTRSADMRLAAWADCFRAQLWSLTAADRVSEASALAAEAAGRLSNIGDDAGVAKARLVRAGCLARLGRVGDCEAELDLALGAARAAGDRRRTVAVLGAAPLAALWGPSPVARAGGRCLDVLRLLRITTASPTVEATSIRCQGMLEALRGRHDASRTKFETSRAMARELGLRHALYETELFAGLAELLVGDAVAAEPHLRAAHDGLGRLGIGADAGQAAALLARSLLLQGRIGEADELATAALDTAGQNLQTAIAARAVLAEVRAAQGAHEDARVLVDEALSIVAPTDVTFDHALTLLAAARVAAAAGNDVEATRRHAQADDLLAAKGVTLLLDSTGRSEPAARQTSGATTGSERDRPRIWNRAVELGQRATEAATARDRARFMACFAADFTTVDHGAAAAAAGFAGRVGAESWTDFAMWLMEQSEGSFGEAAPIATRGDLHALVRFTLRSPTTSLERLQVVSSDGVVLRSAHFFDPDQLFDAIDELDQQWQDNDPSAVPPAPLSLGRRIAVALFAGDDAAMRAVVTDDFVVLDHQRIGLGERGVDAWIESSPAIATGQTVICIPVEVVMGDERRVLERYTVNAGYGTWEALNITQVRDGLVSRAEHFDGDDIEAATARYRALAQDADPRPPFKNTASEVSQLVDEAVAQRDADAFRSLLAPGFRTVWHERLALGPLEADRDTFVDVVFDVDAGRDRGEAQIRLLAVRGDHLALTRSRNVVGGAEQSVRHRVNESLGRQLTGVEWFDADQLDEAVAELDRRYLLSQGFAADHWLVEAWPHNYATNADELLPYLHPDVEFVEHRRFQFLGSGVDDLLRSADAPIGGTAMITQVFRVTNGGALFERVETEPGAPGETRMLMVLGFADERVRHLEVFDVDALDAAVARYDELASASTTPRGVAPNRAYMIADEFGRATVHRDRDAMLGLLTDDFVSVHKSAFRVALGLSTAMTRLETVDELLINYQEGSIASQARSIVATRGDHLYLSTSTLVTVGDDELVYAVVGESDDTRLRSMTYFSESQLSEARDELDRRYRLACGIDDDHWIARNWDALTSFDADRYDAILAAEFRSVDHRSIALGVVGRGDFLEWLRATPPSALWSIPAIHRLSDRGMVAEHAESWADGAGDTRMLLVAEFGDGGTRRLDAYEPVDLDAALARYDEIAGAPRRGLTNSAWEYCRRRQDAYSNEDRAGFAAMFDAGFVAEFHDPLWTGALGAARFDKSGIMEMILHPHMMSNGAGSEAELIAIRGDDLCLYRLGMVSADGDLTERLVVDETRDGPCVRMDLFGLDQLADALAEIDRRYQQARGIEEDHWLAAWTSLPYTTDFASLEPFLHPEFEYVERRSLGWPTGDAPALRAYLATYDDLPEVIVTVVHRLSEHGTVYQRLERTDHAVVETILVNHFQDRCLRRLIAFEPEDLDPALAEFDAYVAGATGPTLTNRAWELVEEAQLVRVGGDRHRFASFFAEDFVLTSHDPITRGTYDKAPWLEAAFDPVVFGPTSSQDLELVAVRGDDHCLFRSRATARSGDVHERLHVVEVRDGLAVRMDSYPHDQLREAQLELDRRWLASLGFGDDVWFVRHWDLAYGMAFDEVGGFLHRDFEIVDHRPLHFPSGDASTLADVMGTLSHEVDVLIPRIHRISRSGAVIERIERAKGDVLGEEHMIMVTQIVDDAIRRTELYTVDDLPAAIARYEEILSASAPRRTNAAWEIVKLVMLAHREGDRERFASLLAEGLVATAHDPIMGAVDADGTAFDRALFVQACFDPLLYGPGSTSEVELVAVRGGEWCLFRIRTVTPAGDVTERIHALEVNDGLGVRWDSYRDDQRVRAQIELDRRWLASLGFADDHPWFRVLDWCYEMDPAVVAGEISGAFRSIDHRRFYNPDIGGSQMIDYMNTRLHAVEMVIPRYLRLTDRLALFEHVEQTVGGWEQSPSLMVSQLGPDGKVAYLEIFEVDDEAAAIACYDRLLSDSGVDAPEPAIRPLTDQPE